MKESASRAAGATSAIFLKKNKPQPFGWGFDASDEVAYATFRASLAAFASALDARGVSSSTLRSNI